LTLTLEEAAQSGEPGVGPAGEEPSVDLMSIGQFAGLSRLSAKALRLYDELGLLPLARVDPDSGYRWYAAGQLDNARMVASLRQIGVPLAQIHLILSLEPEAAAAQVGAYWSGTEADHAARRDLAGYLVDRLTGKSNVMYEVKVRDIPARSLLCLLRHASSRQEVWDLGKEVIGMLKAPAGAAGRRRRRGRVPDLLRGGEPGQRRPGRVLLAGAAGPGRPARRQFPHTHPAHRACAPSLRTEPAHRACAPGAYIPLDQDPQAAAQPQLLDEWFRAWAAEQQRQPSDLPVRVTLLTTTAPVTDASKRGGSDFAIPLRDRAGAA
jgi:DNA-binding transcriptional MerR regulator